MKPAWDLAVGAREPVPKAGSPVQLRSTAPSPELSGKMTDAAWAHEAERLRTSLGAPVDHGSFAFAEGTPAGATQQEGYGRAFSGAPRPYAPPSPLLGATAVASWSSTASAAGGGPLPLSGLLKGLQVLSDAGAGTTPFGAAALADATAEARRG